MSSGFYRSEDLGVRQMIIKPFSFEHLLTVIEKVTNIPLPIAAFTEYAEPSVTITVRGAKAPFIKPQFEFSGRIIFEY